MRKISILILGALSFGAAAAAQGVSSDTNKDWANWERHLLNDSANSPMIVKYGKTNGTYNQMFIGCMGGKGFVVFEPGLMPDDKTRVVTHFDAGAAVAYPWALTEDNQIVMSPDNPTGIVSRMKTVGNVKFAVQNETASSVIEFETGNLAESLAHVAICGF